MWGGARSIPALGLAIPVCTAGCGGGGGGGGGIQPPPPQPDFTISLSSSSVSLLQGGTSSPVTVSVTSENGFSGNVQITLAGMPSGIISSPARPFPWSRAKTQRWCLALPSMPPPGNFPSPRRAPADPFRIPPIFRSASRQVPRKTFRAAIMSAMIPCFCLIAPRASRITAMSSMTPVANAFLLPIGR